MPVPPLPPPPVISAPAPDINKFWTTLWTESGPQLYRADAIENSPAFKVAVRQAWDATQDGRMNAEAGFAVGPDGKPKYMQFAANNPTTNDGHLSMKVASDDLFALHTHPNADSEYPSPDDIQAAKKWQHPIYVQSQQGLFAVDATGRITPLKAGTGWMFDKKAPF